MKVATIRWRVREQRPISYDIVKTRHLFHPDNRVLLMPGPRQGGRRFVVLDDNVAQLHGKEIKDWFGHHGIDARIEIFSSGEGHKTFNAYEKLLRALDAFPIHRRDEPIIAIGGGVLTDVVGFAAASYRRSVPHIKVPTTLMGYIDAAIGIKAGINFNGNKNRLGSFEPPLAVLLDKVFLQTLPRRHLLNGVCEIIKLAIICDAHLFEMLESEGAKSIEACFANEAGEAILDRAVGSMLEELTPNLYEETLERKVDFGHTFSYGLEARHAHRLLHGEAVLLDMLVSSVLAQRRGLVAEHEVARIFSLIARLGIDPDTTVLDAASMWHSLLERVDHRNGRQCVPMPAGLGQCVFLNDITRRELDIAVSASLARITTSHEPVFER